MTQLSTGVALHRLCLTVTSEVVGPAALVASGRASTAGETTAAAVTAIIASTRNRGATAHVGAIGVGAGTLGSCQKHEDLCAHQLDCVE